MEILVIDGQGGGLGRQLVTAITALCASWLPPLKRPFRRRW